MIPATSPRQISAQSAVETLPSSRDAVLESHSPHDRGAEFARGDIDVKADSRARAPRPPAAEICASESLRVCCDLGSERGVVVHRATHGAQDADLGLQAEVLQLAAIVVVCVADAAQLRHSFDQCLVHNSALQQRDAAGFERVDSAPCRGCSPPGSPRAVSNRQIHGPSAGAAGKRKRLLRLRRIHQ